MVSKGQEGNAIFWWIAREIAVTVLTITLIGTLVRISFKIFFIVRLKRLGTKTRFALQPLNPFYEYNKFLSDVKALKKQQAGSSMLSNDTQNSSETNLHVIPKDEQQSSNQ